MPNHPEKSQLEAFCARAAGSSELATVAGHLSSCAACRHEVEEILRRVKGRKRISLDLSPGRWVRDAHLGI